MSEIVIHLSSANLYQSNHLILSNVNLDIKAGEFVYLIGKTGTGKSTLLKTIYADIDLEQGEAIVAGFNLNHMKHSQIPYLRRKLGIVFQDFQLLSDRTVNENLFFVLKATDWDNKAKMQERVQEVLEMVGLSTKGFKMPHELSGGEQQRLVIARAFLNHPDIILADEPTGNLDPETSEGIMKLLFDISKRGTAVLMVTHNYTIVEKFPARIIKCEEGKLIESRNTASVLN
jgi:cell division transport system ATP-binding protein